MTSRMGYWIGVALIVVGVAGGTLFSVRSFTGMGDVVDDFVRAPAPGMVRAQLEGRKYVVYLEGPGAGRDFVAPVEFSIVDPSDGGLLPTADYSASLTYSMHGHSGTAQATVTPPRAGTYELRAATAAPPSAGYAVALGESIAGRILRTILGGLAIGGVLVGCGIALLVTTGVRRKRRPTGSPPAPPDPPSDHAAIAGLPG